MRSFQELPIKRQLMFIILLTRGVVMLLACAAFVAYDQWDFRRTMERDLVMLADLIGSNNRGALLYDRAERAVESLATLQATPQILSACIYTNGTPFAK